MINVAVTSKELLNLLMDSISFNGRLIVVLILTTVLAACGDNRLVDLEEFIIKVKSEHPGRVEPLPEFKPFETFVYTAEDIKDPFTTWETQIERDVKASDTHGVRPKENRRKEALETYSLNDLLMLGTILYHDELWALVKAPDGIVYRVRSGNYVGQNHGKVLEIYEDKIALFEIVPDGLGGWEERQTSLDLVGQ